MTSSLFEDFENIKMIQSQTIVMLLVINICEAVALEWGVSKEWHRRVDALNGMICGALFVA